MDVFGDRAGWDMGIICGNDTQIALVPACWICSTIDGERVFIELWTQPEPGDTEDSCGLGEDSSSRAGPRWSRATSLIELSSDSFSLEIACSFTRSWSSVTIIPKNCFTFSIVK